MEQTYFLAYLSIGVKYKYLQIYSFAFIPIQRRWKQFFRALKNYI